MICGIQLWCARMSTYKRSIYTRLQCGLVNARMCSFIFVASAFLLNRILSCGVNFRDKLHESCNLHGKISKTLSQKFQLSVAKAPPSTFESCNWTLKQTLTKLRCVLLKCSRRSVAAGLPFMLDTLLSFYIWCHKLVRGLLHSLALTIFFVGSVRVVVPELIVRRSSLKQIHLASSLLIRPVFFPGDYQWGLPPF